MPSQSILDKAKQAVHGDRGNDYGHPTEDFRHTAALWSVILKTKVQPADVALCMIAVKIRREGYMHKEDNLVDIAGYAETLQMLHESDIADKYPEDRDG